MQPVQPLELVHCSAGDEVSISYIADLSETVSKRQQSLQRQWDCTCSCPRCGVEGQVADSIHSIIKNLQDQLNLDKCKPGSILAQYK